MNLRIPIVCVTALTVLVAGCSHKESSPAQTSKASSTQDCAPQANQRISITSGTVACADAYGIAAKYDLQGEKFQQIGAFRCESGTADVRPLIFQCTSGTAEFAVYQN